VTSAAGQNLAASIRARLLSLAQQKDEDYQRVFGSYAIERFLYRLGQSQYRDRFALKGATLFTLWTGHTHRPTKDQDLFGRGWPSAIGEVEKTIRLIREIPGETVSSLMANRSKARGLRRTKNMKGSASSS
jgi:nucleotidyltransferase AbiEii toxin of type IV toxin-antitoxin system